MEKYIYFSVYTGYIPSIYKKHFGGVLIEQFSEKLRQEALEKRLKIEKIENASNDLDSVINFKVNSLMKEEFERICKKSHSNVSRELKLYMFQVIKQGKL